MGRPTSSNKEKAINCLDHQVYRKVYSMYLHQEIQQITKVDQKLLNSSQYSYSKRELQSNFYKGNSSRHYNCKGLIAKEFPSY